MNANAANLTNAYAFAIRPAQINRALRVPLDARQTLSSPGTYETRTTDTASVHTADGVGLPHLTNARAPASHTSTAHQSPRT